MATSVICQAFFAWSAGRVFTDSLPTMKNGIIPNMYMHAVCNAMDDCRSYVSHKYFESEEVNKKIGYPEGNGAFGAWMFKDGSMLIAFTDDQYAIVFPVQEGVEGKKMVFMKTWEEMALRGMRESEVPEFSY